MTLRRSGLCFFVCLCATFTPLIAQESAVDSPSPAAPAVADPGRVALQLQQVLHRPEFLEATEPDVNSEMRDWLSQWFLHLGAKFNQFQYASDIPGIASLFVSLFVLVVVAGLLYLGIRLWRRQGKWEDAPEGPLTSKNVLHPPEYYDDEIRQAVNRADWNSAWLSTWRQFLSRMERVRLVEADRTRTNREYLTQLRVHPLPASAIGLLVKMVDAYDRFIYGHDPISESDWLAFQGQVEESALLLHLDEGTSALSKKTA